MNNKQQTMNNNVNLVPISPQLGLDWYWDWAGTGTGTGAELRNWNPSCTLMNFSFLHLNSMGELKKSIPLGGEFLCFWNRSMNLFEKKTFLASLPQFKYNFLCNLVRQDGIAQLSPSPSHNPAQSQSNPARGSIGPNFSCCLVNYWFV